MRLAFVVQSTSGTHTCVVQLRRDGALVGEHIVALAGGPLGGGWHARRGCDRAEG